MKYLRVLLLLLCSLLAQTAFAQAFPNKPVRIIYPYGVGGEGDLVARAIALRLSAKWKQPVIVENRPGAAAVLGADLTARAAPDGYTVLLTSFGYITSQFGSTPLPYDPASLTPLLRVANSPLMLYVSGGLPIKTLQEAVAYAKARPGEMMFGSAGIGSSPHLTAELFAADNGMQITHVPYQGSPPAMIDMMSGRIHGYWGTSAQLQHTKEGKMRTIAVANPTRLIAAPNLPTTAEMGMPGFVSASWFGFFVPAKVPAALQEQIQKDLKDVLATPELRDEIIRIGLEPAMLGREDFAPFLKGELVKWGGIIRSRNIKLD